MGPERPLAAASLLLAAEKPARMGGAEQGWSARVNTLSSFRLRT